MTEQNPEVTNNDYIKKARAVALRYGHAEIWPDHLLLVLLEDIEVGEMIASVEGPLQGMTLELDEELAALPEAEISRAVVPGSIDESVHEIYKVAENYSRMRWNSPPGGPEFFYALSTNRDSHAASFLERYGFDQQTCRELLEKYNKAQEKKDEHAINAFLADRNKTKDGTKMKTDFKPYIADQKKTKNLNTYGRNLNTMVLMGKIDPVIGRDKEVERLAQILGRRKKNNAIIIGDPGVGKTAIAEGLARKIAEGDVPEHLLNKNIFSLDLGSMVSGTKFRGDFEQRLKDVLKEAQSKDVILFIDEIHTIIGAGSAEGTLDLSNMIKAELANGNLTCIGATTTVEYEKHFRKDSALDRRFQPVTVREPSLADTVKILKGLREAYEKAHGVVYPDNVLKAAAVLSARYIADRRLPDKAIDLLDEAGARKKMQPGFKPGAKITVHDIETLIAEAANIPVGAVGKDDREKLNALVDTLKTQIYGQDNAVQALARAVRRGRVDIGDPKQPVAKFMMVGPTGVGKTELARALSDTLGMNLIKLDMSEFMDKHSVSRLTGTTPGFIGFEEGGQLTNAIRRNPHSVILFDEIEKAHPDVYNLLLQILEDGVLTDGHGRVAEFKHSIVLFSSNLGTGQKKQGNLGFSTDAVQADNSVTDAVKRYFKPEFLNRLDEVLQFSALTQAEMPRIVQKNIRKIADRLAGKKQGIELTPEAEAYLAKKGFDPALGARPAKRLIDREVADRITDLVLEAPKALKRGIFKVDVDQNKTGLTVTFAAAAKLEKKAAEPKSRQATRRPRPLGPVPQAA